MSTSSSPAGRSTESPDASYAGRRLGLPAEGPGAVASWSRRFLALLVDWVASLLVAGGLTGGSALTSHGWESWVPMLVFLGEASLLTPLTGGSFGQVLTRLAVVQLDGRPTSLLGAVLRTLLVCLVVPPLIYNIDRRGLHDLVTGTVTVRR